MTDYPIFSGSPPETPIEIPHSTTAIVSLVGGILGLTLLPVVGSLIAIITGSMAKTEIVESAGALKGESLARVGIILGWVGVSFAVLGLCLAGLIFGVSFCIITLGLSSESWGVIIPSLKILFI